MSDAASTRRGAAVCREMGQDDGRSWGKCGGGTVAIPGPAWGTGFCSFVESNTELNTHKCRRGKCCTHGSYGCVDSVAVL